MPSISCDGRYLSPPQPAGGLGTMGFYYGPVEQAAVDALTAFDTVVLQADQTQPALLAALERSGVRPLAYLSVGQDAGPLAAWHRRERDPDWGAAHVHVGHPDWSEALAEAARDALRRGFGGLFLDTLDAAAMRRQDRDAALALVRRLGETVGRSAERTVRANQGGRFEAPGGVLVANRGFGLLPELAGLVDALVFESYSSSWTHDGSCAALEPAALRRNAALARAARAHGLAVYALDYVDSPRLHGFARRRARQHGLGWTCASERMLMTLPSTRVRPQRRLDAPNGGATRRGGAPAGGERRSGDPGGPGKGDAARGRRRRITGGVGQA